MSGPITGNQNFPTSKQIPNNSIMDINGRQTYLGNCFSLPISGVSLSGTTETNVAQIICPSTSLVSIFLFMKRVSSVSFFSQFKFYANPTVTAGTTATPVNMRIASSTASISSCSTAPTGSTKGTLIETIETPTADGVSSESNELIIIDPGNSILITCTPGGTTLVTANLFWFEI
jgi:hypothetical protein